ncbi:hypothetical protein DC20_04890 [Rufibacter tibetensis]|uniref:Uncharacterized protein n=1 Tax=Rufibacter tibetensis TaxID=512763 RepID=A0A0P0D2R2_9BACT|nr:hypothetical protein DC20_04890 [Rufibacter tibetensis]
MQETQRAGDNVWRRRWTGRNDDARHGHVHAGFGRGRTRLHIPEHPVYFLRRQRRYFHLP